jgi:hypothetical protein
MGWLGRVVGDFLFCAFFSVFYFFLLVWFFENLRSVGVEGENREGNRVKKR